MTQRALKSASEATQLSSLKKSHAAELSDAERSALHLAISVTPGVGRIYAVMHNSKQLGIPQVVIHVFSEKWYHDEGNVLANLTRWLHFDRPTLLHTSDERGKWQKRLDNISGALVYNKKDAK